jgi:predicted RND superfamily exporter protein
MLDKGSAQSPNGDTSSVEASSLALGIERIGFLSLSFPLLVIVALLALAAAAVFGIGRIKVDDSLGQLFRSDTPEYKQYEEVSRRFPSSEFDVLIVVQGNDLLQREPLGKMRDLVTDLQLIEGTNGIISLFSARQPPTGDGTVPSALFPEDLPTGAAYDQLIARVRSNEIIRGKLLSDDGKLALIVLSLDPGVTKSDTLSDVVGQVRATVDQDLAGSGLQAQLTGVPVMQLEIRNAIQRDRLIFNAIGFLCGCLIAILFFRRVSFMVVAAAPPLLAIVFSLGAFGWLGFQLNMFLNLMTPLIMVISFSDSMQLTFAMRDRLMAGDTGMQAARYAILVVGPACVLTHVTAGLSFAALTFTPSDLIRSFGEAGIVATLVALMTVLTVAPLLAYLLLGREARLGEKLREQDLGVNALRQLCRWIAGHMVLRPGLYSLASLIVVAGLTLAYAHLAPHYRLADEVPDQQKSVQAANTIDAKLTGANPIDVLVAFPPGASLYDPQTLRVIDEVHAIVEKQAGVGNVWSLATLQQWLRKAGKPDVATLKQYVDMLPEQLVRRFIAADHRAVVISGRVPDADAHSLLVIVDRLDKDLAAERREHPGYSIAVTGLSVIAARNSASMIRKLSGGLTVEIVFVAAFIGLAFRSLLAMLVTFLPALFPIVLSGSLLGLMGNGLQFASVVALTVSFGLGLSATIHFLNRLRREDTPQNDPALAVQQATILVGPALILTSLVLSCALVVTVFSDLPMLRLFGWLGAFAMFAALLADLFILRPTIVFMRRWLGVGWRF